MESDTCFFAVLFQHGIPAPDSLDALSVCSVRVLVLPDTAMDHI